MHLVKVDATTVLELERDFSLPCNSKLTRHTGVDDHHSRDLMLAWTTSTTLSSYHCHSAQLGRRLESGQETELLFMLVCQTL
jgi:hypothetical protein